MTLTIEIPNHLPDIDKRYIASALRNDWLLIVPSWAETLEARDILESIRTQKIEEDRRSGKMDAFLSRIGTEEEEE